MIYTNEQLIRWHIEWLRGDHDGCNPRLADAIDAQAAQIERLKEERDALREALTAIVERSNNDPLGTSKVVDMRNLALKAIGKKTK